jgi:hypothetical protein
MPFLDQDITANNSVTTVDATPTTILIAPFPTNTSGLVTIYAIARNPATGDTKCFTRLLPFKRAGAGLSFVGSSADLLPSAGDAATSAWDIQFNLSGNIVNMQVVGVAATTIKWYAWAIGGTVS